MRGETMGKTRSASAVARLLAASDLLPGLGADRFLETAARATTRHLTAGEELYAKGDPAGELHVVARGEVEVVLATATGDQHVSVLGTGAVIGEIGILTGASRSATVRAVTAAELVGVDLKSVEALLAAHPAEAEALAGRASERLHRTQLLDHFTALFGPIDPELLATIERHVEWEVVPAGRRLFAEGDPGDAAYLVATGRLTVSRQERSNGSTTEVQIGEVGRGDIVGELALIEDSPRMASVDAIRDSRLIKFSRASYDELVEVLPWLGLRVATRALQRKHAPKSSTARPRAFLVVAATDGVDTQKFATQLVSALGPDARALRPDTIDTELGQSGAAQVDDHGVGVLRLTYLLEELEEHHSHVVYIADATWTPWSRRGLRSADAVVLVADATQDPQPGAIEDELWDVVAGQQTPVHLVLRHPPETELPSGTRRWIDRRPRIAAHHHVRAGDAAHMGRLSRLLAGTATALVLGGGGVRGFAHLGVLDVLDDLDVPVDAVAGTSIGSIMAVAPAMGWKLDRARATATPLLHGLRDYTLPATSLLRGGRIASRLRRLVGGDIDIADFWIPYFCVSADLTTATPHYHDRGDAVRAIRASIAIPGVLPPVPFGDHLHVDGGIVDNIPVVEMRRRHPEGTIIAVDVAPVEGPVVREDYGLSLSGVAAWRARRRGEGPPSLMATMVRASLVSSIGARQRAVRDGVADLFLEVGVDGGAALDFGATDEIIHQSATATRPALSEWAAAPGGAPVAAFVKIEPPRRNVLPPAGKTRRRGGVLVLTARDLQYRAARLVATVTGIAVVLALLFLMTGLTAQFHNEPRQTVGGFGAPAWLLREGSGAFTSGAVMPASTAELVADADGTPLVLARHSLRGTSGAATDVVIAGFWAGGLGQPEPVTGRLPAAPHEVVVDRRAGLAVGEQASVGDVTYDVVGMTEGRTMFAGMPIVYMDIAAAQSLVYRGQPLATAVLLSGEPATVPDGYVVVDTSTVAADAMRPLERAISSVNLVRVLLWLVTGLVIGTMTYLAALERRRDVAVLKAVGASTTKLAVSIALQGALVALVAAGVAAVLQVALVPLFPLEVSVPSSAFVQIPVIALVVSQLAGIAGLRKAAGVEPAVAFQGPSA